MPSATATWKEWHLTDEESFTKCAEELFNLDPAYRSIYSRVQNEDGSKVRSLSILRPLPSQEPVKPLADEGMWVVVMAGLIQVLTFDQYQAWRAAL